MSNCERRRQLHVHEFTGSTQIAERGCDAHNHRIAGITGEAIRRGDSHVHRICNKTDFLDHFHDIEDVFTGPAIRVCRDRHVHFVFGVTRREDGHRHEFILATLIENPIGEDK